jgi:hypothetical protein
MKEVAIYATLSCIISELSSQGQKVYPRTTKAGHLMQNLRKTDKRLNNKNV